MEWGMHTGDFFKAKDGIRYNLGANAYVIRISNYRTNELARFIMEEKLDENFGKFIKQSHASQLSWASRNLENRRLGIVTFNIPEKAIAYKVVFSVDINGQNIPIKAFSSIEEGKWHAEDQLPDPVRDRFSREINRLVGYYYRGANEGPVIFR